MTLKANRRRKLSPRDHCYREDGCRAHGPRDSERGICCCCKRPAEEHSGCDCDPRDDWTKASDLPIFGWAWTGDVEDTEAK